MSRFDGGIRPRAAIITLGCRVNQYESTALGEELVRRGFELCGDGDSFDVCIVNTCTVTAQSDKKARQSIRRAHKLNPGAFIIVTGCAAQSEPELFASIEGVGYVCGTANKLSAANAACDFIAGRKSAASIVVPDVSRMPFEDMSIAHFGRTRACIKIEDGCDGRCSYCIIPSVRGHVRSKLPSDVLSEVETVARGGCREVILTGIETSDYQYDLLSLVEKIAAVNGIERIRFGSLDPSFMKPQLSRGMAAVSRVMPHFHLSMQSGCDRILALMRRKYNSSQAFENMEGVRAAFSQRGDEARFTTDIMVGFPGESDEDFADTVDFVRRARYLHCHIFTYSPRPATEAAKMEGQIPENIKNERAAYLEKVCENVRRSLMSGDVGKDFEIIAEAPEKGENGIFVPGHTPNFTEVRLPVSDVEFWRKKRGQLIAVHAEREENGYLICSPAKSSE